MKLASILAMAIMLGCASALPRVKVEQVTIHARGDSGEIDAFANTIKATLIAIVDRLDLQFPATGLEIFLFDTHWEMRRYLWQHCPEQSSKAAACFARSGGYVVTVVKSSRSGKTERMLHHELTHFLLASQYRDLPRWVDEGLAQCMEVDPSQPHADKRKEFRKQRISHTKQAVIELISLPAQKPLDKKQYLLSWALVSFLMQEKRFGLSSIKEYLAHVEAGGQERSYFESAFGSVLELYPIWESFLAHAGLVRLGTSP